MLDIEAGRAAVCAATASLSGISGSVFAVADAELAFTAWATVTSCAAPPAR